EARRSGRTRIPDPRFVDRRGRGGARRRGGIPTFLVGVLSPADTMPVVPEIRLPTLLRPHANGAASVTAAGATVAEAFADLTTRSPGLAGQLVDDQGNLHRFVNVYRNDDDIRSLDRLDTSVADTDVISILPAVAGG